LRCDFLSLPVRPNGERVGERGYPKKKFLLSPTLSSLLRREEREKRQGVPWFRAQDAHKVRGDLSPREATADWGEANTVPTA